MSEFTAETCDAQALTTRKKKKVSWLAFDFA